jgi:hypothetical protein
MTLRRVLTLLVLILSSITASATTFIVPPDDELIRSARYVVRGVVTEKRVFEGADGTIRTHYAMQVERAFKGKFTVGEVVMFEEYGGFLPHRFSVIVATPEYEIGERALVMLQSRDDNKLRTHAMALGKFAIDGDRYVRGTEDESIFGFDREMNPHIEYGRAIEAFDRFIEDVVAGRQGRRDYIVPMEPRIRATVAPNAKDYTFFELRRKVFDTSGSAVYQTNGDQPAKDGIGAVGRGLDAWSGDSGSNVNITLGGTTAAVFGTVDGINAIELNMTSGFPGCAPPAVGCANMAGSGTHTIDGLTFNTLDDGDIWIKSFVSNQATFDAVITHEIGHTIGFRHADQGTPSSNSAIMTSSVGGLGAVLQTWDIDAVRALYGNGGSSCTAPAITTQPVGGTISSGTSTTLTVAASGTSPTFQWFKGTGATPTTPAGNSSTLNTGVLTQTTNFFVRVSNSCGTVDSNIVTVTVECAAPNIPSSGQPQGTTIFAGQSAQLVVSANGSPTLTYQWFRGESGNTSSPVFNGTQSFVSTGVLSETTSFWVRVTNSCGTADSQTAVVTVTPCTPPQITAQPQPQQITTGTSTTLSVDVIGTDPVSFQWFRGASGVTNNPVFGATSRTLNTGNLTTATSFWVRITNPCSTTGINSDAAQVSVVAACTAPAITGSSPTAVTINAGAATTLSVTATGTSLAYQWFRGESGDASNPVTGATGSVFATGALSASGNFWVRVSNSCGTANSPTIRVTVTPLCDLTIVTHPLTQTVNSGTSVVLTAGVTGTGSISFQWFKGISGDSTQPVTGATSSTLTLSSLRQSGSYWLRVTSPCGTRNSNTATITVETTKRKRPVKRG